MRLMTVSLFGSLLLLSCADKAPVITRERVKSESDLDKFTSVNPNLDPKNKGGSGKKSDYAGKSFATGSDFGGKDYAKKSYTNKRWGGETKYNAKSYSGKRDANKYKYSPDFVKQQAAYSGQSASVAGKRFGTDNFTTKNASEQKGRRINNVINNYAQRNNLDAPVIMSKADRAKLSVDETNSALGR